MYACMHVCKHIHIYIYIYIYTYIYTYIYIVNIQLWVAFHLQVQPIDPTASRRHAAQESLGVGSWRECLSHRRCDRAHWYFNHGRGRLIWLLVLQALTSPFAVIAQLQFCDNQWHR